MVMSPDPIRVALDVSCALDQPRTGVGYATVYQVRALAQLKTGFDWHLFATRSRHAAAGIPELDGLLPDLRLIPFAGRIKRIAWSHVNWPPVEWFCGECQIAHGLFHLLPAARHASRVVTVHDLSFMRYPEMHTGDTVRQHRAMLRYAVEHADAIVTISTSTREELEKFFNVNPQRVYTIPLGIDTTEFQGDLDKTRLSRLRQELELPGAYVIYLGTLEPRKNVAGLVEAYAALRHRLDPCPKLLMVGKKGWMFEPVFEAIKRLRIEEHVLHAGHLDREDAVTLLRDAVACAYPSFYEGFGLPVLEAMAAGTPVVASNATALPEVAGDAALLVDPADKEALTDAMERLVTDEALREQLKERGRARAQELSWASSAGHLADLYRQLAI